MKLAGLAVSSLLSLLVASAAAGGVDFIDDVRRDFGLALFPRQATNLQTFTGALGGASADPITNSGNTERPFEVDGDTFPDFSTAAGRSCDNQKNACAKVANSQQGGSLQVSDCDQQNRMGANEAVKPNSRVQGRCHDGHDDQLCYSDEFECRL